MREFFAWLGEIVQEKPAAVAGLCAFLVAFTLVAANAHYGQPGGRHPQPIFATRKAVTDRVSDPAQEAARNERREETEQPRSDFSLTPIPLERIPVPVMRPRQSPEPANSSSLVERAQAELARLGLYAGLVDGVYGPNTRAAVIAFEKRAGLEATGQISQKLVESLQTTFENGPAAIARSVPSGSLAPYKVKTVAIAPPVPGAVMNDAGPTPLFDGEDVKESALIARIQIGLINFGEDAVAVDGVLGPETVSAIRSFQSRYQLTPDGKPSEELVRKLEEIGALRKEE